MSYSLEVVGRGWGSKIIETVLRTWDLLCREFCFCLVCAGDETQGFAHTEHASTPEPYPLPKEFLDFSLSRDET